MDSSHPRQRTRRTEPRWLRASRAQAPPLQTLPQAEPSPPPLNSVFRIRTNAAAHPSAEALWVAIPCVGVSRRNPGEGGRWPAETSLDIAGCRSSTHTCTYRPAIFVGPAVHEEVGRVDRGHFEHRRHDRVRYRPERRDAVGFGRRLGDGRRRHQGRTGGERNGTVPPVITNHRPARTHRAEGPAPEVKSPRRLVSRGAMVHIRACAAPRP